VRESTSATAAVRGGQRFVLSPWAGSIDRYEAIDR
jgi:hypothetical protein